MAESSLLDVPRVRVRHVMRGVARGLHRFSGGMITPDAVTLTGLAMHIPIALLIASRHNLWAALLLVVFGLFDTLDGELARLQKRDGPAGMLLDASTDRFKEVMLYSGAAWALIATGNPFLAVWAVAACGASLSVSYVKAKGETAVAKSNLSTSEVNHLFEDGLMRFEVRMFILIVGLLTGRLAEAVAFIAVTAALTAIYRLATITGKLR